VLIAWADAVHELGCPLDDPMQTPNAPLGGEDAIVVEGELGNHGRSHEHLSHEHGRHAGHGVCRTAGRDVKLERDLRERNARLAAQNRQWLEERQVVMLNLIGSPGAGKTTLLEALLPRLGARARAVLKGDLATSLDATRIRKAGCEVVQIKTGAGCHLDADMVAVGLEGLGPSRASLVLVENVGNLVCPALFDLGERAKVVVMSITEGEDKPLKYPHVFRAADACVFTKLDLLPYLAFDLERAVQAARDANPRLKLFQVSVRTPDSLTALARWIDGLDGVMHETRQEAEPRALSLELRVRPSLEGAST
jgi:hydrogenase nickel incorporation protein HypB